MNALFIAAALAAAPTTIEDNYPRALAVAKQQRKILFVDAWAPWCHTCVFMREHVLNQPAFAPFEKDVVFASIDTEKTSNAGFLDKFPVSFWPTLFFIDPQSETLVFKWVGSADAVQMQGLLDAARKKDSRLTEADTLFAQGKAQEAAEKYLTSLKGDPSVRGTLSLLNALQASKQYESCARTANEQAPGLKAASDRINALTWGLSCAIEYREGTELRASLVKQATSATTMPGAMADDVSGLYELLVEERRMANDAEAVVSLAKTWLEYLEKVAREAPTPAARAAFDPHRLLAAIASKQIARVIPALEQSEKELPKDFNPPARLAIAHKELGKLSDAEAAITRALKKNTGGPRRLRLLEIQASIFEAKADVGAQRRTLAQAVSYGRSLPASQRPTLKIASLEEQLGKLEAPKGR